MKRTSAFALTALLATAAPAYAQATDPYLGQLMVTGDLYCPKGWIDANGQLLSVQQNAALFALFGTLYGGDGVNAFALPDLRGRAMIDAGQGPGLPLATQGQALGAPQTTLTVAQLPAHNHPVLASKDPPTQGDPSGAALGTLAQKLYAPPPPSTLLAGGTIGTVGGGQPIPQYQPTLVLRYCVSLQGGAPKAGK
ncbi:MAG TPA: tail fiber protein [Rhizomicrobium sp.]|nr:tail fiber protein [Rhizomicrobium sp.]